MSAWDILKYTSPVDWLVAEAVGQAAKSMSEASDKGLQELKVEAEKQNLQMQFAQHQARIAQELAISRRIDNAEEVEIEEFYDTAGKGNMGLEMNTESASLGIGAESRRVTKRIYHFKGWRQSETEIVTQIFENKQE